jgi:hypothetical protein
MKIFLTFFTFFLAFHCLVNEAEALGAVPESRKTDILLPGSHGNDVKITILGQQGQQSVKAPARRQQQTLDPNSECLQLFFNEDFYTAEDGSRYFTPEALQTLIDVLTNANSVIEYDYSQSTNVDENGNPQVTEVNAYQINSYDAKKINCAVSIFYSMTTDYLNSNTPPEEPQPEPLEPSDENPEEVDQPPVDQPPVDQPPLDQPPLDQPPLDQPPLDQPPLDQPPLDQPPVDSRRRRQAIRINIGQSGLSHHYQLNMNRAPPRRQAQVSRLPQAHQQPAHFRNIFRPAI